MSEKSADAGRAKPNPIELAKSYSDVAQRASKFAVELLQKQMEKGNIPSKDEMGVAPAFMEMMTKVMNDPYSLAQSQMKLFGDYFSLFQHSMLRLAGEKPAPIASPVKGDNRFRDDDWEQHLLYDFIKQCYLITASHVCDAVNNVEGMDEIAKRKVVFTTRQAVDALSPTNFALTNPQVVRETVDTHGQNLINGFNNLLRDLEAGNGTLRIKMSDHEAFELGQNIATTPGKVIFQNAFIQLLQFNPTTSEQFKRPLLIFPPWINKYYILDLREKNSFIKWATDQGHTVFVVSWVNPDEKLADKSFEDYLIDGALAAVEKVCEQTGEKEVNAIGYCLGGTLLGSTLAFMAAKRDKRIASATFFTTMLDFANPGEIGVFIDEQQVSSLETRMAEQGFLDGAEMSSAFSMLRANDLIWSFVVNNYLMGKDPFPFDLLYWNSDSTRMPYAMHSFYLRNMYMNNKLREPNGITLGGVPIDLRKISIPAYFISTVEDHLAPWKTTYLGAKLLSGPTKFVLGGSGHIAGIVNPPAANKYCFWESDEKALPASADEFYSSAVRNEGSWWNNWNAWVTGLDGKKVSARDPANGKLQVVEDAPGSFAKFRLDAKGQK